MVNNPRIDLLKKRFKDWAVKYVLLTRKFSYEPELEAEVIILSQEADELLSIVVASINTARKRVNK